MDPRPRRVFRFGRFDLDATECSLLRDGLPVMVEPKVFRLLVCLVEKSPAVVPKDELIRVIWPDAFVEDSSLSVCVAKLRKAVNDDPRRSSYIHTIPRRGYRFVAQVNRVQTNADIVEDSHGEHAPSAEMSTGHQGEANRSIAVLPFKFIGPASDRFLGLGIADALITRLANIERITVRPTSSVRKYSEVSDAVFAGDELRVDSVVDGSVQKRGRRIRVTVQLVSVRDGAILWAGKFDERMRDIFAVEDSISEQVASALLPELSRKERKRIAKRYTESAEAHELYLKGRYFFAKRTRDSLDRGIECFNRAIEIDATYALAYVGLADCYSSRWAYYGYATKESNKRTDQAVLKAIELDDELAEAHASLGHLRMRQWNWLEAEREFKRALILNPDYATGHNWYASYLQLVGRSFEAAQENQRALELDPVSTLLRSTRGKLLYLSRQYDRAIQHLEETLEMDPNLVLSYCCLGLAQEAKGRYDKALESLEQAVSLFGSTPELRAYIGRVHGLAGRRSAAVEAIDELTRLSEHEYVEPYLVALIHIALGDEDTAFHYLEKGYAEHDENLALLGVDPRLDNLRTDQRCLSLQRRVGLTNATNRRTLEAASSGRS